MASVAHELNKIKPLANPLACGIDRFQVRVNLLEGFALIVSPLVSHSGFKLSDSAGAVAHRCLPFPAVVAKLRHI